MAYKKDITAGICQVLNLKQRGRYLNNIKQWRKQFTFWLCGGKLVMQSTINQGVVLSTEYQVIKAEIIPCLNILDSNGAFSATHNDNDKYDYFSQFCSCQKHTFKNLVK